jgi:hypothetical protein
MEPLRIRVNSVKVISHAGLAVARVSATSARKVSGRRAARIELRLHLLVVQGERESDMRRRARDLALDYLDVT